MSAFNPTHRSADIEDSNNTSEATISENTANSELNPILELLDFAEVGKSRGVSQAFQNATRTKSFERQHSSSML